MINQLVHNGIVQERYPKPIAKDINEYLHGKQLYNGHVKRESFQLADHTSTVSCYDLETIMCAPHLLELACSYTYAARAYLHAEPYIYSFNIFNTLPSVEIVPYIQEFHRDHDDEKFLALFVFLTDINEEKDGAHQYIKGSHNTPDATDTISIYGKAGTIFLEDGRGLHRGLVPQTKLRRIAWIRWCINVPPSTYVQDGIRPIDARLLGDRYLKLDSHMRELFKLLIS